jgi:hypothetical protein
MGRHLVQHGYTSGYYWWIHHGEADRIREKVVRPRLDAFDDDAGVADMLDDAHQAQFTEGRDKQDMEANAKAFYKMLDSAQKPLHDRTHISQLDAIGRVMGLKAELNLSHEGFYKMLVVFGTMLLDKHLLPPNLYEAEKLLRMLKMPYTRYIFAQRGASYLGKNTRMQTTVQSVNPTGTWR